MGERLHNRWSAQERRRIPCGGCDLQLQVGDKTILTVAMRDITERMRFEKEQQLLAEAGTVLAASLDYEQTLATLASWSFGISPTGAWSR